MKWWCQLNVFEQKNQHEHQPNIFKIYLCPFFLKQNNSTCISYGSPKLKKLAFQRAKLTVPSKCSPHSFSQIFFVKKLFLMPHLLYMQENVVDRPSIQLPKTHIFVDLTNRICGYFIRCLETITSPTRHRCGIQRKFFETIKSMEMPWNGCELAICGQSNLFSVFSVSTSIKCLPHQWMQLWASSFIFSW